MWEGHTGSLYAQALTTWSSRNSLNTVMERLAFCQLITCRQFSQQHKKSMLRIWKLIRLHVASLINLTAHITLHYNYIALHYTASYCTALHYITLHCMDAWMHVLMYREFKTKERGDWLWVSPFSLRLRPAAKSCFHEVCRPPGIFCNMRQVKWEKHMGCIESSLRLTTRRWFMIEGIH